MISRQNDESEEEEGYAALRERVSKIDEGYSYQEEREMERKAKAEREEQELMVWIITAVCIVGGVLGIASPPLGMLCLAVAIAYVLYKKNQSANSKRS